MDCKKTGALILHLRKEKKMTQKEVADAMHISDKTISKWERGMGCPDVTLLKELAHVLSTNVESILSGNMDSNELESGNMKQIKFYVCPNCNNMIHSTGVSEIACCGRRLEALEGKNLNETHQIVVSEVEHDYYIKFNHVMDKEHYIAFLAYVGFDRVLFIRLYPEQSSEIRFPRMQGGSIYFYCTKHGLWRDNL